ncbi:unnamed protein product [Hanseniaspora opuntiae]|uniref:Nucleolar protein 56 n=1 Tax=Hanseniaspora opuntiae TaxID=211096 RepID=A0A1E5RTD8_9ASCO|nr:Nucleolar protein 56 [Hanseniaspora opuntiae]
MSSSDLEYILYEEPTGYAIFKIKNLQDIVNSSSNEVQKQINDFSSFTKVVELQSFTPFKNAVEALLNINDISEGIMNDFLKNFLELNVPSSKKSKNGVVIGISDNKLGPSIKEVFPNLTCISNDFVQDLLRGVRLHSNKLLKSFNSDDATFIEKAQLGLGHAYSRTKVKFNVSKNDNHIIQAIALLDSLDKDINTFAMRAKEWYGWHFPELAKILVDNYSFAKAILFIRDKATINADSLNELVAVLNTTDSTIAEQIIDAARISMGQDLSEIDMENIMVWAERVKSLYEYKQQLTSYLIEKMHTVAPNLSELIGEHIGARLISHAGSLTNLSKQAASTVQILGAEKALFRALKTKGNTPKYGLIYHSGFIGKAASKNKGRIARYLANKCSIASRIDNYSDQPNNVFGTVLRRQVEQRLEFYSTGKATLKNEDAIKEAMSLAGDSEEVVEQKVDAPKRKLDDDEEEEKPKAKKEKKEKKDKKEKKEKKEKKDKKEKKEKKDKKEKKEKKDKK